MLGARSAQWLGSLGYTGGNVTTVEPGFPRTRGEATCAMPRDHSFSELFGAELFDHDYFTRNTTFTIGEYCELQDICQHRYLYLKILSDTLQY